MKHWSDEVTFQFVFVAVVVIGLMIFISVKFWAKNELCSTYYEKMNRVACFMSDATLPQSNR